jgi:hypothetical protein
MAQSSHSPATRRKFKLTKHPATVVGFITVIR